MAFPTNPANGDIYNEYKYNSLKGAWPTRKYMSLPIPVFSTNYAYLSNGEFIQVAVNGKSNNRFNIQTFSISTWVKMPSVVNYGIIWSYDYTSHVEPWYAQQLRIGAGGSVLMSMNNGGQMQTGNGLITNNTWAHIVITRSPGNTKMYINKIIRSTDTTSDNIVYYDQEVWIGKGNWATTDSLYIKNFNFYNKIISTDDINNLYDEFNDIKYIEE